MNSVLEVIKDKDEKERIIRLFVDSTIGSFKHEGLEDPYGFHWETLYYYGKEDGITESEYFRLHEEYWMAESRMKGKAASPIIKEHAEAPLVTPRSKKLYKKWFINGLINTKAKRIS